MRFLFPLAALTLLSCAPAGPQVSETEKSILAHRFKECQLLIDWPQGDQPDGFTDILKANRVAALPIQSVMGVERVDWSVLSEDPRTVRLSFTATETGTRFDCDAQRLENVWEWTQVSRNAETVFTRP